MAAKIGPATVSYGIGVQNRYSAFLDDEDGFGPVQTVAVSIATKGRVESGPSKSKGSTANKSTSSTKLTNKVPNQNGSSKKFADAKMGQQQRTEPRKSDGIKRPPINGHQPQSSIDATNINTQVPRHNYYNKQGNQSQDNTANINNRYPRNNQNQAPQYLSNKENNIIPNRPPRGMFNRNNTNGSINNYRQRRQIFNNDDKKSGQTGETPNGQPVVANEEEKRRRQQKRVIDLKHKDPTKAEARRQQSNTNPEEPSGGPEKDQTTQRSRGLIDASGIRDDSGKGFHGREKRDGPPNTNNRAPRIDRTPRNRNGFGNGSRGSKGSRDEEVRRERPRQIPNFSDKLDFPSLSS